MFKQFFEKDPSSEWKVKPRVADPEQSIEEEKEKKKKKKKNWINVSR